MSDQDENQIYSTSYTRSAQPRIHPDNLFAIARLHGLRPVPVERAKVLEIGCGDGMNLIPMACRMPEGSFVRVDSAREPVAWAREFAAELGASNFRCHHADIAELADDFGEFDYIIAHGFYSWVPDEVRAHFWRVARGSLSARGMLFVSYNLLPGWRQTAMLRDFVQLEKRRLGEQEGWQRIVWERLSQIAALGESGYPLAIEARRTVAKGLQAACHDEFDESTRPFLFREVLKAAEQAGFHYVGDALQNTWNGSHEAAAISALLDEVSCEHPLVREEYADVVTLRTSRQSVFCHASHAPDDGSFLERAESLSITAAVRMVDGGKADARDRQGSIHYEALPGRDLDPKFGFNSDDRLLAALVAMLAERAPERVPVGEILQALREHLPGVSDQEWTVFLRLFEELVMAGAFALSARPLRLPSASQLGAESRPQVGALNRLEAAKGRALTSLLHRTVPLEDPLQRALLLLCDGQTRAADIATFLARGLENELAGSPATALPGGVQIALRSSPALASGVTGPEPNAAFADAFVLRALARFRELAILEAA
jgi:SAM-dependent methyltransferase